MWPSLKAKPDTELLELFEAAGENARLTCTLLRDLLAGFPDGDGLAEQIRDGEHEGDRIAHEILLRLAGRESRGTGLEAVDVHALTGALDDVVDYAEEAADQLGLYGVEAPMEQSQQLAEVLVSAAGQVSAALDEWRDGADMSRHLIEVHRLENDADRLVRQAVGSLFATGIDPMLVIRWKDIFETLESAVDACERVANVLEGIVLKQANGHR
jgi:uncharacterized protein Yka (UPF0111/DUF47 family)